MILKNSPPRYQRVDLPKTHSAYIRLAAAAHGRSWRIGPFLRRGAGLHCQSRKKRRLPAEDDADVFLEQSFDDCGVCVFCAVILFAVKSCAGEIETAFAVKDHGELHVFLGHTRLGMHVQKPRGGVQALIDVPGFRLGGGVEKDLELRPSRDFKIGLDGGGLAKSRDDGSGCEGGVLSMNCGGHEEKEGGEE